MKLTSKDVEHVAMLARLELTEQEKDMFAEQLTEILEYVNKLNELDTSRVEPVFHVVPLKNVFREDEEKPSLSPEEALRNAPDRGGNFFRVPKVVQ